METEFTRFDTESGGETYGTPIGNRRTCTTIKTVTRVTFSTSSYLPMEIDLKFHTGSLGIPGPSLDGVPTPATSVGGDSVTGHPGTVVLTVSL